MTVTINGTTGIAGTNGSAGTPAVQGEDTNTGIFFPAADTVAVATAGSERLRIDASGNVGIGVTPSAWNSSARVMQLGGFNSVFGYTNNVLRIANNAVFTAVNETYGASSLGATYYQQGNGSHAWFNAPSGTAGNAITFTQAMTLDASGNLLVNMSSPVGVAKTQIAYTPNSNVGLSLFPTNTAYNNASVTFLNNGGSTVGFIYQNASSTQFSTTSDYRLKEDWQPMTGASERVLALKPVNFAWKVNGSRVDGFLAHEAQAVVPEAVTGAKDDVDEDGNPKYQGIDQSKLVPLLTAALQEALAEIAGLKARITALEA